MTGSKVFEPSFDWKECRTPKFIVQKLNYIHWNPCKYTPKLADLPQQYQHSQQNFISWANKGFITLYMELMDIDLTASL